VLVLNSAEESEEELEQCNLLYIPTPTRRRCPKPKGLALSSFKGAIGTGRVASYESKREQSSKKGYTDFRWRNSGVLKGQKNQWPDQLLGHDNNQKSDRDHGLGSSETERGSPLGRLPGFT